MTLNLQAVARATGASGSPDSIPVTGWSVDTRTQNVGDLYIALRGPNHDGHDFVRAAVEKGAAGVLVERPAGVPNELLVSDTLRALQSLASQARRDWGGRVVAVTGSAGKTTTKDAVASLLSVALAVGKTNGNFNNHVGVPLSILRLPGEARVGVLEMGMNHAGEIRDLARIARPDVGVVTNVGYAHVESFDSIEGVAAAKRELIEVLPPEGVAELNADDPRVARFRDAHPGRSVTFGFSEGADVRAERVEVRDGVTAFSAAGADFETALPGRHAVMNLLAAIAVARVFDIPAEALGGAVRSFTAGRMRGERLERDGVLIWNDCYNSNPEAARSMIDVLRDAPAGRRIAVLGEMLELGRPSERLHREVGEYAARNGVDFLIGVRGAARAMVDAAVAAGLPQSAASFVEDAVSAGELARRIAQPGDAVLFKGSRGVALERALERFLG